MGIARPRRRGVGPGSEAERRLFFCESRACGLHPSHCPIRPCWSASGCHGPYFLRNIVELETDSGIVGIGETHGGRATTQKGWKRRGRLSSGRDAFAYRSFGKALRKAWGPPATRGSSWPALMPAAGPRTDACASLLGGPRPRSGGVHGVALPLLSIRRRSSDDPGGPASRRWEWVRGNSAFR